MKQALQNLKELKQTTLSIQNLYNKIKESELTSNSNEIKKYLDYFLLKKCIRNKASLLVLKKSNIVKAGLS